jgi:hypothetical protein
VLSSRVGELHSTASFCIILYSISLHMKWERRTEFTQLWLGPKIMLRFIDLCSTCRTLLPPQIPLLKWSTYYLVMQSIMKKFDILYSYLFVPVYLKGS